MASFKGYKDEANLKILWFEDMKKDLIKAMTKFFRKGEVGDWKNYFSGKKLEEWDAWIKTNLEGTDIKIRFE